MINNAIKGIWVENGILKSISIPLIAGPKADPRTETAVAIAFIEPRCFVPKFSAQKAPGIVEFAP